MSFKGILFVDAQPFNIVRMKLSFFQPMDGNGRPNAQPNGGFISLAVESSKESKLLMSWMLSPDTTKAGEITFIQRDNEGSMKSISFENAHCVAYDEVFEATGTNPMLTQLTISAKSLSCEDVKLDKDWEGLSS